MLIDASNEIWKDVASYLVPLDDNGNAMVGVQQVDTETMVGKRLVMFDVFDSPKIKFCECYVSKLVMKCETPEHIKEKIRDLLGEDIEVELEDERGTINV